MTTPTPALRSAIARAIHDRNNPAHVGLPVADAVWRQYLGDADAALLALTPFLAPAPVKQTGGEACHECGGTRPWCELQDRIRNYLGNGGLFNPEFMEHQKVRDLLMDINAALTAHFQSLATENKP